MNAFCFPRRCVFGLKKASKWLITSRQPGLIKAQYCRHTFERNCTVKGDFYFKRFIVYYPRKKNRMIWRSIVPLKLKGGRLLSCFIANGKLHFHSFTTCRTSFRVRQKYVFFCFPPSGTYLTSVIVDGLLLLYVLTIQLHSLTVSSYIPIHIYS